MGKQDKDCKDGLMRNGEERGIILKGIGGQYTLLLDSKEEQKAIPRGNLRKKEKTPYPGDMVFARKTGDDIIPYSIERIAPRKSFIRRPAIANLDALVITISAKDPEPDMFFVDKMIIIACKQGIEAAICITKTDLDMEKAQKIKKEYKDTDIPVFLLSGLHGKKEEYTGLKAFIKGRIVTFAGQSGVGKSTLLNRIIERQCMETGEISGKNKKGKHTTRHSEVFPYKNGFLADTPGFSSLDLKDLDITGDDVRLGYPEINYFEGKCKFKGCRHLGEKGCAILKEKINPNRMERYEIFRKEADSFPEYKYK